MTTLQVGGRFPHFYVIVSQSLRLQASTRNRIRCVFKSFHSEDESPIRNKMFADTNESGYVWTGPEVCFFLYVYILLYIYK